MSMAPILLRTSFPHFVIGVVVLKVLWRHERRPCQTTQAEPVSKEAGQEQEGSQREETWQKVTPTTMNSKSAHSLCTSLRKSYLLNVSMRNKSLNRLIEYSNIFVVSSSISSFACITVVGISISIRLSIRVTHHSFLC